MKIPMSPLTQEERDLVDGSMLLIPTIIAYRKRTGTGLREAKDFVEREILGGLRIQCPHCKGKGEIITP